ncbi:MAG: response regulator [Halobacteriovoraceae bacterium]|nr:response regulator [Halobacteriovoraceae bacterium]
MIRAFTIQSVKQQKAWGTRPADSLDEADAIRYATCFPEEIALIFLEAKLPHKDGSEIIKDISLVRAENSFKICAMTEKPTTDTLANYLKVGVDDFIAKPFSEKTLKTKIEELDKRKYCSPKNINKMISLTNPRGEISEIELVNLSGSLFKFKSPIFFENTPYLDLTISFSDVLLGKESKPSQYIFKIAQMMEERDSYVYYTKIIGAPDQLLQVLYHS